MDKLGMAEATAAPLPFSASANKLFRPYHLSQEVPVPDYLQQTYWWAYLHPKGVKFFERQWLVNAILWGNFSRLRDAALEEIPDGCDGKVLQVACVYGDFSPRVAERLSPQGSLEVADVAPVQLDNLCRKVRDCSNVFLHHQDSTRLSFADASHDYVVVFFLLHEQPGEARARTVSEALRVARPGGKVIFVDYHRPSLFNPFHYIMRPILTTLEPFALDMWRQEITTWVPEAYRPQAVVKQTFFGGLYQKVVMVR